MKYDEIRNTLSDVLEGKDLEEVYNVFIGNLHHYEYADGILTLEYNDTEVYQLHGENPEVCDVCYILDDRRERSSK